MSNLLSLRHSKQTVRVRSYINKAKWRGGSAGARRAGTSSSLASVRQFNLYSSSCDKHVSPLVISAGFGCWAVSFAQDRPNWEGGHETSVYPLPPTCKFRPVSMHPGGTAAAWPPSTVALGHGGVLGGGGDAGKGFAEGGRGGDDCDCGGVLPESTSPWQRRRRLLLATDLAKAGWDVAACAAATSRQTAVNAEKLRSVNRRAWDTMVGSLKRMRLYRYEHSNYPYPGELDCENKGRCSARSSSKFSTGSIWFNTLVS